VPKITWHLSCPLCRAELGEEPALAGEVRCPSCAAVYPTLPETGGVRSLLPPARRERFAAFLADYTKIRLAERRGSDDPADYLALPGCRPDHPIAWQWALRRRTFASLTRRVLPRLGGGLKALDLGAGVGWLSHRLGEGGHHPCAVDLSADPYDGLGAARHFQPAWPRLQAEFDRLPFPDAEADLAVFNASLHYSTDYRATLAEALRVLRPGGALLVLESPVYRREESGRRMVEERHADFARRFGTRSESLPSREFLTWTMLDEIARDLGVSWRKVTPWYGWRWAMRPWVARLQRKREPSRFAILWAEKPR
jgi:SAM-dependent methyltransferase